MKKNVHSNKEKETVRHETLRIKKAFDYYYSLGEERTLAAVAREWGVSNRTVARWSVSFNWQERVQQRDIENSRVIEQKTNEAVTDIKANYRKMIKAAMSRWLKNFQEDLIELNTVQDLEKLIKLDLQLMGEASEAIDIDIKDVSLKLHRKLEEMSKRKIKEE